MIFYVLNSFPNTLLKYYDTVVLIKDKWDDWFRYETQCIAHYINEYGENIYLGQVKIGQFDMKDNQRTAEYPNKFFKIPNTCFSLGQSEEYYENIKLLFNGAERDEFYNSMNDIAFDLKLFEKVKVLNVTRVSLMRYVSAFMVKNQFNRIAHGNAKLTSYDIEYTYPTENTDTLAKISFHVEPESFPPTNIHVIIGRNNVGKTFLIKHLIASAYDKNGDVKVNGQLKSTSTRTGMMVNARTQAFANILCISFSPFDNYDDLKVFQETNDLEMPFSFIGNDMSGKYSSKFVDSLSICQSNNRKMALLRNALKTLCIDSIFENSGLTDLIDTQCNNANAQDYLKDNNEYVKKTFDRLSSGHQVIMLSLIQLIERISERTLIVLDEPENHLHPPLLSAFIRALSELLIAQNGVAIVATHSPVILQEVPKSCVWKINRFGYEVSVDRLGIESFGANIGSLLYEVFGLEVNNSGFHKMLIDEVNKGKSYAEIVETFNGELGDEARSLLRMMIAERN